MKQKDVYLFLPCRFLIFSIKEALLSVLQSFIRQQRHTKKKAAEAAFIFINPTLKPVYKRPEQILLPDVPDRPSYESSTAV